MIKIYTNISHGEKWLGNCKGKTPIFACVLGFTSTALIPSISTAGATPQDRQYTAIADGEFLVNGVTEKPLFPLPPLIKGISPVFISRAVIEAFNIPIYLFNAGLPHPPSVANIDLGGIPAQCVSTGNALPLKTVKDLFAKGLQWGEKLGKKAQGEKRYLIIGECVVGGTTTALSVLTALGISAQGKVNSSHPHCNHQQKWIIVKEGLAKANLLQENPHINPLEVVAKVGDPMQIVVTAMGISASKFTNVMLAGGTQMLAVYGLINHLFPQNNNPIVIGTTKWVAQDATGDTVGLAQMIPNACLIATQLDFTNAHYEQLRLYEKGYVKEGVGAGGLAIASSLYQNWTSQELITAIEKLIKKAHSTTE
jgi:uncharacterized protein (TIGR00303 family)